jgi:hypothetical protein
MFAAAAIKRLPSGRQQQQQQQQRDVGGEKNKTSVDYGMCPSSHLFFTRVTRSPVFIYLLNVQREREREMKSGLDARKLRN